MCFHWQITLAEKGMFPFGTTCYVKGTNTKAKEFLVRKSVFMQ